MGKRNLLIVIYFCTFGLHTLFGQGWDMRIQGVDTSGFPQVKVFFNLFDNKALLLKDVKKTYLTIYENKKTIPDFKLELKNSEVKLRLAIMLDVSGSMVGGKFVDSKTALNEFLTILNGRDECAMVTFGTDVAIISNFSTDYDGMRQYLNNIQLSNKTRLNDGIIEATKLFSTFENTRNAIILITDGKDEGSVFSLQSAIERAQQKNIEIFSIAIGEDADLYSLEKITKETGASYFGKISSVELRYVLGNIYENLLKNYVISYRTPDSLNTIEGTKRKIGIKLSYQGNAKSDEKDYVIPKRTIRGNTPYILYSAIALAVVVLLLVLILFFNKRKVRREFDFGSDSGHMVTGVGVLSGGAYDDEDEGSDETNWEDEFNKQIKEKKTVIVNKGKSQTTDLLGYLIMRSSKYGMQVYELKQREIIIGRADSCDIVLDDDEVSKQHTKIRIVENKYYVDDMGSANGTMLNDAQTYHSELKDGDSVKVYTHEFIFKCIS